MLTNQNEKEAGKFKLGARSRSNMVGLHPHLIEIIELGIQTTEVDFTVIEGLRSEERQRQLLSSGATTTMNSRHLTGHAFDFVALKDNKVEWNDITLYVKISNAFKAAATKLNHPIVWGGDWRTFKDYGHVQLNWKDYP